MKGNERFRTGKMTARDYLAEKRASAAGQYPAAVVLGCLDSRVPAEIIFDTGIGDAFVGRVAGNVVNDDMLGSMEFACGVSGAKVLLILGHTACGALKRDRRCGARQSHWTPSENQTGDTRDKI